MGVPNQIREKLPGVVEAYLAPGEYIQGIDAGDGGYGDPLTRDPTRVLQDVLERWETLDRARSLYGVAFTSDDLDDNFAVDLVATHDLRNSLRAKRHSAIY